jgi:hypothetical protein
LITTGDLECLFISLSFFFLALPLRGFTIFSSHIILSPIFHFPNPDSPCKFRHNTWSKPRWQPLAGRIDRVVT